MPSTVLGAGRPKAQSLVLAARHLAEKTDTETNDYKVVNMIIEVLSRCPGRAGNWGAGADITKEVVIAGVWLERVGISQKEKGTD